MRIGLTPGYGRRRTWLMAATSVLSGLTLLVTGLGWSSQPQGVIPESEASEPVRIRIPAISVDAPVQPLIVDQNGVLPPPDTYEGTGWWRDGPEPGERGPAVIAGHLDSHR